MAEITYGAPQQLTLEQLTDWLWGQEIGTGPVIAIGNNGHTTAATFRHSLTEPTEKAVISLLVGGQAIIPAGKTEVCSGEVFILSQKMDVVVYR